MNITMGWNVMNGCLPAGASGGTTKTTSSCSQSSGTVQKLCGDGQGNDPNPCQGSFDGNTYASPETVQQAYSGAYSLAAALPSSEGGISTPGSYSGTISSASVVNSSGAEIQSIQNGTNTTNNTITVDFYGYEPDSTVTNPTNPFELTLGGNQGNGDLGCAGNNGKTSFDAAIESGCAGTYETNTLEPPATVCPNGSTSATPGPATCLKTNPGGGKSTSIAQALNTKINGSASASCTSPNYWAPGQNGAPGNSVGQILSQTINGAPDPRLVELFITDNMTLPGGAATVPIRGMAEFYITGWGATMNKGSDPCVSGSPSSNPGNLSLPYTSDDTPPDNTDGVIMGHFVTYVNVNSTPSNSNCIEGTLAICSPVLLK